MLRMKEICCVYQTDLIETHALRNIDLHVEAGEFVAITGPSGSGKTTLLNLSGLLESATSGTYMLDGRDVSAMNDKHGQRSHEHSKTSARSCEAVCSFQLELVESNVRTFEEPQSQYGEVGEDSAEPQCHQKGYEIVKPTKDQ